MRRVSVNKRTLRLNVQEQYDIIEQDLVNNAQHLFNEYEYYTRKYRGDLINDVNVGLFIDNSNVIAQIYVSNGIDTIKTHLILSKDLKRISRVEEIINTFKPRYVKTYINPYGDKPFEIRYAEMINNILAETNCKKYEVLNKAIEDENIVYELVISR